MEPTNFTGTITGNLTIQNFKLYWTEPTKSRSSVYNTCTADTPFGLFVLAWRQNVYDPDYGFQETPWGNVEYWGWSSIEQAKQWAEQEFTRRLNEILSKANHA